MRLLVAILFAFEALANPTFNALLTADAFNPGSYGNAIWWIAARKETTYSDGASVGTATDWSASGLNAVNSTNAAKPTYKTAIVNSLPVFRADGTDDCLKPASNPISGKSSATLMFVFKQDADPPASSPQAGAPISNFGSDAAAPADHTPWTDGNIYIGFASTARKTAGNPSASLASWSVITVVSAASDYRVYVNGTLLYSTATNTFGASSGGTAALFLSSDATGGFYTFDGDLAEIVIWDSALGTSAREGAENALGILYGITITH